jgi:hypothetical protein
MPRPPHAKPGAPKRVASEYLLPPLHTELRDYHRVSLVPDEHSEGVYHLTLDPNFCSLDEYGEPLGCTRMACYIHEVQLERINGDKEQTLYDIVSKGELPAQLRLLTVHSHHLDQCPARLFVMVDEEIEQIVHLHSTEQPH